MAALTNTYGVYGERTATTDLARTAYAGEVSETDTGCYLLGERLYQPTLRRFLASDRASPFDRGGHNRYAYCSGDPVNRIDPSGHAWLDWLGATLGFAGISGAARGVSSASRVKDAASSPSTMASTAVAMADVFSVVAGIDSVALAASGRPRAGVFGRITVGAALASAGLALPPARTGSPTERFVGMTQRWRDGASSSRGVQRVTEPNIPADRLMTDGNGKPYLTRKWLRRSHSANPGSRIWAADTAIASEHFTNLFRTLAQKGIKEVNLYTGAHGSPHGDNWHPDTGKRLDPDDTFFIEDFVRTRKAAESVGMKIRPVNMANLTRQQVQRRLMKDGVHILGTCYGLADEVVMEALKLTSVTVYQLDLPCP
jgi:RHS repeat-associated protein